MAVKNIEININNGSTYDTLYPKTDYSNIINTPSIPSVPISIANGGTNGTTGSAGIYNLTNPCSTRSASQLNSYASNTYIPCTYGNAGYKFSLNNIMTYVNNNVSAGAKVVSGSRNGTGSTSYTIVLGGRAYFCIIGDIYNNTISAGLPNYGFTNNRGIYRQMNGATPIILFYDETHTTTEQYVTNKDAAQIVIINSTVGTSGITINCGQNADSSTIGNDSSTLYSYTAIIK